MCEDEAMEVEERWGENDVIDMDVDMTEEEQLSLITEIHSTRCDLSLVASVDSVTQQPVSSLTYTVSVFSINCIVCTQVCSSYL